MDPGELDREGVCKPSSTRLKRRIVPRPETEARPGRDLV